MDTIKKRLIEDVNSLLSFKKADEKTILCELLNHREMFYCACMIRAKYGVRVDFQKHKTISDIAVIIERGENV